MPQIHPFSFGDEEINSGETVSIQCTILKGDPPLNITWLLNGRLIDDDYGITIVGMKRFSTLNVDSVRDFHSGNYTCVAENDAGSDSFSTALNVNGTFESANAPPLIPENYLFFLNSNRLQYLPR